MKRIFSFFLALTLLLALFPVPAYAAETATGCKTLTVTADPGLPDNEELFASYARQTLYDLPRSSRGISAGSQLSGNAKILYDALVPVIRQIADGKRKSTAISVGTAFRYMGTLYEPDVKASFKGKSLTGTDLRQLITALLSDLPYEMYWYDKTSGCSTEVFAGSSLLYVNLKFTAAKNYRSSSHAVDTTKTSAAARAAANANYIVSCYANATDYNKLLGYSDALCDLADYDYDAASKGSYANDSDPWQLIHIFDGDPNTKAVCESYSKAYLFLCDLSDFRDDVRCYTVTGSVNGAAHMWNIVTLEEKNYLVDVTNTDTGTYGNQLLLAGCTGDIAKGYQVSRLTYRYDSVTKAFWGTGSKSILKLSGRSCAPDETQDHEHSYGSWNTIVSATPSRIGVKSRSCSKCGYVDSSCASVKSLSAPSLSISTNSSGKPKLSWKAVSGADAYRVYRATSKSGSYTRISSTSSTGFTDSTAKLGKKYYYKVVALDTASGKTSGYSSILSKVCTLAKPTVSITGSSSTGKPIVKWKTVEGAVKYYIYRAAGDGSFSYIKSAVSARSFEDTTAKAGTSYSYKVKAVYKDTAANSPYSDVVTRVCDLPRPTVTLKLNSSGAPYLSWKEISGAKNYRIYRSETKDGEYTYLASTTKLKYADKTAEAGTEYFYRVKAMHTKSAAASAYSPAKSITP